MRTPFPTGRGVHERWREPGRGVAAQRGPLPLVRDTGAVQSGAVQEVEPVALNLRWSSRTGGWGTLSSAAGGIVAANKP
ncbi:hypothetical protein GCM10010193_64540 [Kitasatospora atroaurantiaca]